MPQQFDNPATLLGALAARLNGEWALRGRWWLAAWLALVTHPLLDWMTVYGTQLLRPFTDTPYAIGSIFIIDPLYTLPLLVGVGVAVAARSPARWRWNAAGLLLSSFYLGWTVAAQAHVRGLAQASLARQGIVPTQLLVTPAPLNTVLWRVVAMTPDSYHEGFRSMLDPGHDIAFERFDRGAALAPALAGLPAVERMRWFTRGFFKLSEVDGQARITDLRMGQEPYYSFSFGVARRSGSGGGWVSQPVPSAVGGRPEDLGPQFDWLGQRMLGRAARPPR